ncbi:MAG TPA: hypothetical protein VNI53_07045 [Gammaproteobacteria bacterium]|nr:hypothetical protein [Gammaproteobacteria bacterium]
MPFIAPPVKVIQVADVQEPAETAADVTSVTLLTLVLSPPFETQTLKPPFSVGLTVRAAAVLVTPEALAVTLVLPAATPVAKPVLLIVATPALLEAQVKLTPLMVLPEESMAVAMNCWAAPTAMLTLVGDTVMEAIAVLPPPPLPELLLEELPPPPQAASIMVNKAAAMMFNCRIFNSRHMGTPLIGDCINFQILCQTHRLAHVRDAHRRFWP